MAGGAKVVGFGAVPPLLGFVRLAVLDDAAGPVVKGVTVGTEFDEFTVDTACGWQDVQPSATIVTGSHAMPMEFR